VKLSDCYSGGLPVAGVVLAPIPHETREGPG